MFDKFNDIKVGDYIETFIQIEEKVKLTINEKYKSSKN